MRRRGTPQAVADGSPPAPDRTLEQCVHGLLHTFFFAIVAGGGTSVVWAFWRHGWYLGCALVIYGIGIILLVLLAWTPSEPAVRASSTPTLRYLTPLLLYTLLRWWIWLANGMALHSLSDDARTGAAISWELPSTQSIAVDCVAVALVIVSQLLPSPKNTSVLVIALIFVPLELLVLGESAHAVFVSDSEFFSANIDGGWTVLVRLTVFWLVYLGTEHRHKHPKLVAEPLDVYVQTAPIMFCSIYGVAGLALSPLCAKGGMIFFYRMNRWKKRHTPPTLPVVAPPRVEQQRPVRRAQSNSSRRRRAPAPPPPQKVADSGSESGSYFSSSSGSESYTDDELPPRTASVQLVISPRGGAIKGKKTTTHSEDPRGHRGFQPTAHKFTVTGMATSPLQLPCDAGPSWL